MFKALAAVSCAAMFALTAMPANAADELEARLATCNACHGQNGQPIDKSIPIIWGPLRHGPGHNVSTYHHNPDSHVVEFYTELDQMKDDELGYFDPRPWHQDRPQRPKVWGPDTLRNYWGFGSERIIRGYQTVE